MKILITVDPEIPVPPKLYGGIERVVDLLVCELIKNGHVVTLLAHPESRTPADLRGWRTRRSQHGLDLIRNIIHVDEVFRNEGPYDLVHSFARMAYLIPILPTRVSKIQTYQRQVTMRNVRWGSRLAGRTIGFTACSQVLVDSARCGRERWETIPNGVCLEKYRFVPEVPAGAPFVFLGRFDPEKGAHHAIDLAHRMEKKLILAGPIGTGKNAQKYFDRQIAPHIDGEQIKYMGELDDVDKGDLLGRAAALLFPIEWQEPFGIVMVEALACGTPILALRRGSVPEVVHHGVTGWIASNLAELEEGARQITQFDRKACRQQAEQRFSSVVIAKKYMQLYESMLAQAN